MFSIYKQVPMRWNRISLHKESSSFIHQTTYCKLFPFESSTSGSFIFSIVCYFIVTQNLCHQFHIGCHVYNFLFSIVNNERRKSLNTQLCMLYFHKINSEEELLKGGHLKYCQIAHYKGCTNLNWWMLDSTNSQEVFHLCKTNGILLLLKFSYVISWWVQETYD